MWEEGYVGITAQGVNARFYEHKKAANSGSEYTVAKAIRKYKDALVIDEIVVGSREYCLWLESILRPSHRIGWNIIPGGGDTPTFNRPHTEDAKRRIGEASKLLKFNPNFIASVERRRGVKRPKEHIASAIAASAERRKGLPPWEQPRACKEIWEQALRIFDKVDEDLSKSYERLSKDLELPLSSIINMVKKIKQGWNPNEDSSFLNWLKNRNITNDYS